MSRSTTTMFAAPRGYVLTYRIGESNHCPGCGGVQWHVGRQMAECGRCETALPLADPADRRQVAPRAAFGGWRSLAPA